MIDFSQNTNAVVTIPDHQDLRPENNSRFSFSCWIYLLSNDHNLLPRIWNKGAQYSCIMGDPTNGKYGRLGGEATSQAVTQTEYWGTTILQLNKWYHYVYVFNDERGRHYIDGVEDNTNIQQSAYISPVKPTVGKDFLIGNSPKLDRNWGGYIQEARFYQIDLDEAEIRNLTDNKAVERELVAYWPMHEKEGTVIKDATGNGHDGVLANASLMSETGIFYPNYCETKPPCKINRVLHTGLNKWIGIEEHVQFRGSEKIIHKTKRCSEHSSLTGADELYQAVIGEGQVRQKVKDIVELNTKKTLTQEEKDQIKLFYLAQGHTDTEGNFPDIPDEVWDPDVSLNRKYNADRVLEAILNGVTTENKNKIQVDIDRAVGKNKVKIL